MESAIVSSDVPIQSIGNDTHHPSYLRSCDRDSPAIVIILERQLVLGEPLV